MVGVDITDVALDSAAANRAANPHLAHLLEVRRVEGGASGGSGGGGDGGGGAGGGGGEGEQGRGAEEGGGEEHGEEEGREEEEGHGEEGVEGQEGDEAGPEQQDPGSGKGGKGKGKGRKERGQRGVGPILAAAVREDEAFHFCMCNPPFFSSIRDANQNPRTACGGGGLLCLCTCL